MRHTTPEINHLVYHTPESPLAARHYAPVEYQLVRWASRQAG